MLFACFLAFQILPGGLWTTSVSCRVSEVAGYVQSLHCSSWDHRRENLGESQKQDLTTRRGGADSLDLLQKTGSSAVKNANSWAPNLRYSHMVNLERGPRMCILNEGFR